MHIFNRKKIILSFYLYTNHWAGRVAVKIFASVRSGHCCRRNSPFESEDLKTVTELLKSTFKLPLHHRKYPELDNKIQSYPSHRRDPRLLSDSNFEKSRVVNTLNAMSITHFSFIRLFPRACLPLA